MITLNARYFLRGHQSFGVVAFGKDLAEICAKEEGKQVIMVHPETKPYDVHTMLAIYCVPTRRGERTSHAALVARKFVRPNPP